MSTERIDFNRWMDGWMELRHRRRAFVYRSCGLDRSASIPNS